MGSSARQPASASGIGASARPHLLLTVCAFLLASCGYTTRPGLAPHLRTLYVHPFTNKIDITQITPGDERFPIYRHRMEIDITNEVISRFQFTGLLRPASAERADCRLDGELVEFRREPLRYDASQHVEEWRLNIVVNLRFTDQRNRIVLWEAANFTGDTTYFALGTKAESESAAITRAITDLARRIVERSVESW